MNENTKKIIQEKFDALPESIQEMIMSSNYEDTLITVGQKNNLTVNQMGILERETTLVMMGLTDPKDFEIDITRELGVDNAKGNQIVTEINEKIFLNIRTLLKLMNTPIGEDPMVEEDEEQKTNTPVDTLPSPTEDPSSHISSLEKAMGGENKIDSILAQKLAGTFQAPKITTEYAVSPVSISTKNPIPIMPKVDPYRMPIE